MKRISTYLVVLHLVIVQFSCSKDKVSKETIDEKSVTKCLKDSTHQYLFSEYADVTDETFSLTQGTYRLFWAETKDLPITNRIFIKAPMRGIKFEMRKSDILTQLVKLIRSCPTCYLIPMKPADGYIKGTNVTPNKRADQTKWLLEIKLYLKSAGDPLVKDTINITQYFHPNFVYD